MINKVESHESVMHIIADKLMVHFEGSSATNYIEQTFEDKEDSSRSFVLTMQMKDGLTPCEKLSIAQERIAELEAALQEVIYHFESGNGDHSDLNDGMIPKLKELAIKGDNNETT